MKDGRGRSELGCVNCKWDNGCDITSREINYDAMKEEGLAICPILTGKRKPPALEWVDVERFKKLIYEINQQTFYMRMAQIKYIFVHNYYAHDREPYPHEVGFPIELIRRTIASLRITITPEHLPRLISITFNEKEIA